MVLEEIDGGKLESELKRVRSPAGRALLRARTSRETCCEGFSRTCCTVRGFCG